ncbi:RNA polymerase beta'' subunit (plastid) [Cryptomonas paramecium]|uniref:DNA-directed RNA polymerase n=1 Tax=Cryptomonas paramaecium TaxID=2898 RepID=D2IS78_9CRYP|nr:RNA polymerase beta'' subunit [Cryptomonas paramecium]ACT46770.1 RNA polymerase beta'' subunit [Cryptomonas paramecium]BDA98025.1 RNA polymerase beta'' subunit [Cryptomonas paramecium]
MKEIYTLPKAAPTFTNKVVDKKKLKQLMSWMFTTYKAGVTSHIVDKVKELGFQYATEAGISISIEDLKVPPKKQYIVKSATQQNSIIEKKYTRGETTIIERLQNTITSWGRASESIKNEVIKYFEVNEPLNPVYMMASSGARGNMSQVRQLVGMRGLMSDPHGQIIGLPIKSNFKEGLTATEYIISCYGARKGVVDTALKTANSGYLTRRLVDVVQDIVVREKNCNSTHGVLIRKKEYLHYDSLSLTLKMRGRCLFDTLCTPDQCKPIARQNECLNNLLTQNIISKGINSISIRSPLTCISSQFVCQLCYGWNLTTESLVDLGEAVGVLAAQSIGEPGTQLTMRTFHTGGVFTGEFAEQINAPFNGIIEIPNHAKTNPIKTRHGNDALLVEKNTHIRLWGFQNENTTLEIKPGSLLFLTNNEQFKKGQILAEQPLKTTSVTEKVTKELINETIGEVFLSNVSEEENEVYFEEFTNSKEIQNSLWILYGDVYSIPTHAKIIATEQSSVIKGDALAVYETKSEQSGIIKLEKDKSDKITLITASAYLENAIVTTETKEQDTNKRSFLKFENGKKFLLLYNNGERVQNLETIAILENDIYSTETGGLILYFNSAPTLEETKKPRSIYWIPEETHIINKPISLLIATNQSLVTKGQEIVKGIKSCHDGFLSITSSGDYLKEVSVKPGELYSSDKINPLFKPGLFFPGEEIVPGLIAKDTCYVEAVNIGTRKNLLLRTAIIYTVTDENTYLQQKLFENESTSIKLKITQKTTIKSTSKIKSIEPITLVSTYITVKIQSPNTRTFAELEFCQPGKNLGTIMKLCISEEMLIKWDTFAQSNQSFVKNKLHVHNGQRITPGITIAESKLLCEKDGIITNITALNQLENKLLVLTKKHNETISIGYNTPQTEPGRLVYKWQPLANGVFSPCNGYIMSIKNNLITIRHGTPYLTSCNSTIYVDHLGVVDKNNILAKFTLEQPKTGDIIQGLPRIEEILEARKPKEICQLARRNGRIKIETDEHECSTLKVIENKSEPIKYQIRSSQKMYVSNKQLVNVASKLTEGTPNLHEVLSIFFTYYTNELKQSSATRLALLKTRRYLVNEVQNVYQSQGVHISDKHIEIIAKRMTSKVQVNSSGDTTLLPNELIELEQFEEANGAILESKGKSATYSPVLLGITKTSLNTNSFLSAAGFQETTRVLSRAAIEGRKDSLTGLKENVSTGRLIPAGTGYNQTAALVPE